jgi:hypothetical protein
MRRAYDLKVFINPQEALRLHWKIKRDTAKRGYTPEKIREQLAAREADSAKYIQTQGQYADLRLEYFADIELERLGNQDYDPQVSLRIVCENNADFEPLIESLAEFSLMKVEHKYNDEDKQELIFTGDVKEENIAIAAFRLIPELEEITLGKSQWEGGYNGIVQLLSTYLIFYKMRIENE